MRKIRYFAEAVLREGGRWMGGLEVGNGWEGG